MESDLGYSTTRVRQLVPSGNTFGEQTMTQSHTVQTKHFKLEIAPPTLTQRPATSGHLGVARFSVKGRRHPLAFTSACRHSARPFPPPPVPRVTTPEKVTGLRASLRGSAGQREAGQGTRGPAGLALRTQEARRSMTRSAARPAARPRGRRFLLRQSRAAGSNVSRPDAVFTSLRMSGFKRFHSPTSALSARRS